MDPINANIISSSDTRYEPRTYGLAWRGLAVIEILLFIRLFLGDFVANFIANPASGLSYAIFEITNYIVYPFAVVFGFATSGGALFIWTTLMAMLTYLLLTITLVRFFRANSSPRSRVEHARALSRRRYSR